jgi:hypothetical protein
VKDKVDNGIILSWVGGMIIKEAQYQHLEQTQWNNVHSHDPSGIPMPLPPIQKMAREKFPAQFQHRYLEQNIVKESMYLCVYLSVYPYFHFKNGIFCSCQISLCFVPKSWMNIKFALWCREMKSRN